MKDIEITRFKDGALTKVDDVIAEEFLLHLVINSDLSFDVIISPTDIKEFVFGNLFTEGFIGVKDDVQKYNEKIKETLITVNVKLKNLPTRKQFLKKNYNIVWTECGSRGELMRYIDQFKPFKDVVKIKSNDLLNVFNEIKDKIGLFKKTGAFHYAFLLDKDIKLHHYAYDIGRHNAVDKVLGRQLLVDGNVQDKVLFTTGRISSDIILKCLRAKVPVLVSRGAPLDTAVNLARNYNMCLIGFLRGKRFNIYSNPEAIVI